MEMNSTESRQGRAITFTLIIATLSLNQYKVVTVCTPPPPPGPFIEKKHYILLINFLFIKEPFASQKFTPKSILNCLVKKLN